MWSEKRTKNTSTSFYCFPTWWDVGRAQRLDHVLRRATDHERQCPAYQSAAAGKRTRAPAPPVATMYVIPPITTIVPTTAPGWSASHWAALSTAEHTAPAAAVARQAAYSSGAGEKGHHCIALP